LRAARKMVAGLMRCFGAKSVRFTPSSTGTVPQLE